MFLLMVIQTEGDHRLPMGAFAHATQAVIEASGDRHVRQTVYEVPSVPVVNVLDQPSADGSGQLIMPTAKPGATLALHYETPAQRDLLLAALEMARS